MADCTRLPIPSRLNTVSAALEGDRMIRWCGRRMTFVTELLFVHMAHGTVSGVRLRLTPVHLGPDGGRIMSDSGFTSEFGDGLRGQLVMADGAFV